MNGRDAGRRAELVAALKEAFAYCDATYASLTDASSAAMVPFFGQERTKLSMLAFNTSHSFEHYGNLVTYLRMNGLVPPSSDPPSSARVTAELHNGRFTIATDQPHVKVAWRIRRRKEESK